METDDLPFWPDTRFPRLMAVSRVIAGDDRFSVALLHRRTPHYHAGYTIASGNDDGWVVTTDAPERRKDLPDNVRMLHATGDFDGDAAAHLRTFQRLYGGHRRLDVDDLSSLEPRIQKIIRFPRIVQWEALLFLIVLLGGIALLLLYLAP